jgi:MFS family permease
LQAFLFKVCAYRFLDTFVLIYPLTAVMFADAGLSPAQIGVALAAWSLTGLVLEAPSGVLADHVSRRWLLAVAQGARAAGFVVWIAFPSFWGFLAGLTLWGVKSALMSGTFEALVYDELKSAGRSGDYARVIGRAWASRYAGLLLASLGAAALVGFGYAALIAASAAAVLASAAVALSLPEAPRSTPVGPPRYIAHLRRGAEDAVRLPGVLPLLVFIAGVQGLLLSLEDYWQLFGREVGLAQAQVALFIAAMSAAQGAGSMLAHRLDGLSVRGLYGLLVVAGVAVALAAVLFRPWVIVLLIAVGGLSRVIDVSADARFQHALAPETRATVASVKGLGMQLAYTALILGFGAVAQATSYRTAFIVCGAIIVGWGAAFGAFAFARRTASATAEP